jgi:hypothetical protein
MHFHWLFMYRLITSIGAPPAVNKQKLGLQKYSFQRLLCILGNSFFTMRILALLYALINLLISVFGYALKSICTWSVDSTAKGDFVDWRYIQRFL